MTNKDNILITGGNGMIGSNLDFGIKPSSKIMNICNYESIKNIFDKYNIECIIHLASINIKDCDNDIKKAIEVNINGTINLIKISKEYNIPFIFISSGAVFSSINPNDTFNEKSSPCPNCIYGYTKLSAEKIASTYDKSIIIRTGWLYGSKNNIKNYKFVENSITNILDNKTVYGSNDFFGSPTYIVDFIEKMLYLIENKMYGIYHIINEGYASGYEIAVEICNILNKDNKLIIKKKVADIPNANDYRSNSEKLQTNYDFLYLRNWKIALNEYIKSFDINHINMNNINAIYKKRHKCRLCNQPNLIEIFNLNPTPPANQFIKKKENQEYIPLDICLCNDCKHIQLLEIIDPKILYQNYFYLSSTSSTMVKHLCESVDYFIDYLDINKTDNILEIGSNDGTIIQYLLNKNFTNVIGIDPAKNIKTLNNLPIICDFFSSKKYEYFLNNYGKFKLIFGFHCCAHIENNQDVFKTVFDLLEDNGVFVMEIGYFYDVFKNKTFDTIYHEHIDYYTCTSIKNYCDKNNVILFNVKKTKIQGGSIQFFICKNVNTKYSKNNNKINKLLLNEKKSGIFDIEHHISWFNNINEIGINLNLLLDNIKKNNYKIAGYGASAKSTTFLHQFKIHNILEYIIDDNIYKIDHFSPGLHIPIKPITELQNNKVNYILILSWNFRNEIIKKLKQYTKYNIKIIIPFPNIKII